jgi:hypothetical protein
VKHEAAGYRKHATDGMEQSYQLLDSLLAKR